MSVLGMFCLAVLEMCTRKASACDVLAVYGQITLHINALGLGCITLLGHACWALVQLLLLAAAFAWVVFIWGAAAARRVERFESPTV
ncbi:unnamed protein product [Effrenium voratum]|uniref:Uncharacterized protein n=1 Tax=Effrenium voratum TaxID=2562239 RepID=A0AA36I979_9DINO|nr:unnamed protein product [Effrenium voratum]